MFPPARCAAALGLLLVFVGVGRAAGSGSPAGAAPYEETWAAVGEAWAAGRFENVRADLRRLLGRGDLPAHVRSYAHLRLAQSLAAAGTPTAAAAEYARLAADPTYPEIHRAEAWACAAELERVRRGLPPRESPAARAPVAPIGTFALELFVAPGGDDRASGTRAAPFATPERARDELRARRAAGRLPAGPVAVRLLPGEYVRTRTFELAAADSGAPLAPVVYRADRPGTAVWYGGRRLPAPGPVTDPAVRARLPAASRDRVVQFDLAAAGLDNVPPLQERGYGRRPPAATLELYCDGRALTLARWPDTGFVDGGPVLDPGSLREGVPSRFTYLDDRHARWVGAPDAWLGGYFAFGWADRTLRLRSIEVERREVSCGPYDLNGHTMKPESWFNRGRIRYYVFNLLEELDAPGEWYLDHARHRLYVLPPATPAPATFEVGALAGPMMVARGVQDVRFEGLIFDLGQANGLEVRDSERVLFAGCTVRRFAAEGLGIRGGRECGIFGCDLYSLGRNATTVIGGDRPTLTPGRHFVENCRLSDFGRLDRTYVPAVQLEGVGNRVAHNLVRDSPASAVRIEGNDHVLEYNRVHRVLLETEDQGAMELFGNATYRGVVFRHNVFSDIGGDPPMRGPAGRAALRFDDAVSGLVVYGNLFVRAAQSFGAININGGRDHLIDNNLFIECAKAITGGYNPANAWWGRLGSSAELSVSELYLQRYPALARVREPPGHSAAWRNVFWRCGPLFTTYDRPTPDNFDHLANVDCGREDPGFVDAAAGDYRLRPGAPLLARVGFRPLPIDEAGPYAHPLRAAGPVAP
jgi:hypothetical protein